MRILELNILSNDYIVCSIEDKSYFKYIKYNEILEEIFLLSLKIKNVIIDAEKLIFNTDNERVIIKNYKNNKDITLKEIIDRVKNKKIKDRKEYLKNKKIKRKKVIAEILILSTIFIGSVTVIHAKKIETETGKEVPSIEQTFNNNNSDKKMKSVVQNNYIEQNIYLEIDYENRTNTEKYRTTKAYYEDLIKNISREYGIDYKIMLAIATQESGIHNERIDRAAIGLMQIEKSVWKNQNISAYNYNKKEHETLYITEEKLKDLEFNIRVACMHFQNCLKNSQYNLPVAIQMYNFGYGNIEKTFKISNNNDVELKEALNDYDNNWLNYRSDIKEGDSQYLEHILSYIEDLSNIKCLDERGDILVFNINKKTKAYTAI